MGGAGEIQQEEQEDRIISSSIVQQRGKEMVATPVSMRGVFIERSGL